LRLIKEAPSSGSPYILKPTIRLLVGNQASSISGTVGYTPSFADNRLLVFACEDRYDIETNTYKHWNTIESFAEFFKKSKNSLDSMQENSNIKKYKRVDKSKLHERVGRKASGSKVQQSAP
jgi:hypothetical protein